MTSKDPQIMSPRFTPLFTSQSIFLLRRGRGIPLWISFPSPGKGFPQALLHLTRTPSSETSDALSQLAPSRPPGFAQSCCHDFPPRLSGEQNSCVLGLGYRKGNGTRFHRQPISPSSPGGRASLFISHQSEGIRTQALLLEPKSIYPKHQQSLAE